MTTQKLFKRRVRERMAKTGERYAAARRQVGRRQRDTPPSAAGPGRSRARWSSHPTRSCTRPPAGPGTSGSRSWTVGRHGSQARARSSSSSSRARRARAGGRRRSPSGTSAPAASGAKHQQADGFTVYASKTVGVPLDVLFDAFVDERTRDGWLTDGAMSPSEPRSPARWRASTGRTARRGVLVTFEAKGPCEVTAHVAHERLPDAAAGEAAKAAGSGALAALKAFLESRPMTQPRVILERTRLRRVARWHDGRLWFAHWGTDEIIAVDLDGTSEVVGPRAGRPRLVDRLAARRPAARRPATGCSATSPMARVVPHADLSASRRRLERARRRRARQRLRQRSMRVRLQRRRRRRGSSPSSRPTASVRQVADGIAFPNGMVVTPDNRTLIVAESFAGTAHGVRHRRRRQPVEPARLGGRHRRRTASASTPRARSGRQSGPMEHACVRVREGGEVLERDRARPQPVRLHARRPRRADAVHPGGRVAGLRKDRSSDRGSHRPGACRRRARPSRRMPRAPSSSPSPRAPPPPTRRLTRDSVGR